MKTIGNIVIFCGTSREYEVTKRILDSKKLEYAQFDGSFEVYESKTPQEWQRLLKEIDQECKNFSGSMHYILCL